MNGEAKSLKFNAFVNGLRTVLNLIFPLITFPYISRVLSVEEIGKYNFSDSIVSYFLLIAALGINQYAVREGTQFRNSQMNIDQFASRVFSVNVISTVVSYVALGILLLCFNKLHSYWLCIVILSIQIFFTTLGTEWLYSIYEEYTYITIRSIVFKLISIILLFVLVRKQGDYIKYAMITVLASAGSNVLNYVHAKKLCNIRFTWRFDWIAILRPVFVIFASNLAIQIYVNSDITMLGYLGSDHAVGIYSVSTKIYTIIKNVFTAILTVTIPRFSLYAGKVDKDSYDDLLQKVVNTLIMIILPAVIGLIMLRKNIIVIIAGGNYLSSQASLCILSVAILFSVFNGLFSQCVLLAYKRENSFLQYTAVSAIVNIVLNLFFIPLWAEVGAAITTLISELMLCLMLYIRSRDIVSQVFASKSTKRNLLSVSVATTGMVIICLFVMNKATEFYLQTFGAVVVSIITYGLILVIFRNEIVVSNMKTIKKAKVWNKFYRK